MNITAKEFKSYLTVQVSGVYNMFSQDAIDATGLDKETYMYVIKHYSELIKEHKEDPGCKDILARLGFN